MVYLRLIVTLVSLSLVFSSRAQAMQLLDAPQPMASLLTASEAMAEFHPGSPLADPPRTLDLPSAPEPVQTSQAPSDANHGDPHSPASPNGPVDANGDPIPLNRLQPKRILGFMPNFRTVSGGAKPHPPGWKYNFTVATRQATDYSSFIFLEITSLSAEGIDEHPVLGKGVGGAWAYSWRGFLDKTDNTYLSAWLLPSLIHEDTRFYAMGAGHAIPIRALYVISRQGVARTYSGHQTPNIAGLGGKILTQIVSRTYYPTGATSFSVLAVKFGYSAMRDVAITSIREFYPDAAAHFIRKHREKKARLAAENGTSVQ
jgi:hypothetical protein